MKNKMFLIGLLSLSIFAFPGCSDDNGDELVGNWKKIGDFDGETRSEAISFVVNNTAYLGTGYNGKRNGYLRDMWKFDQGQGTWTQIDSLGVPGSERSRAVAFGAGNFGYVGLGYIVTTDDSEVNLKDFWKYDTAGDTWTQIADFKGTARRNAVAFALNVGGVDKGFVGTGYDNKYLKDFYRYDPTSNSWEEITPLPGTKRRGASSFVIDNKGYVVLGENNAETVGDFWMYDANNDSWIAKRKITNSSEESYDDDYNMIRANAACFVINGKAYITCGDNNKNLRRDTWEYDPVTDLWKQKTSFEKFARSGAIGFSVSNRGFVTTGSSGEIRFDDMHEFFPDEEYYEYD